MEEEPNEDEEDISDLNTVVMIAVSVFLGAVWVVGMVSTTLSLIKNQT